MSAPNGADTHDASDLEGIQVNQDQLVSAVLRGSEADLAALRNDAAHAEYLQQREPLVSTAIAGRLTWKESGQDSEESSYSGNVFVTSTQLLFVGDETSGDVAIGAACIQLHALMEEPEVSVYLQISEGDDENTAEVTIIPVEVDTCQALFDGLCKLVSLNPIDVDDDEEGGGQFSDGGFMGDDMIWAPSSAVQMGNNGEDDEGATEEERAAMLNRLDNVLVVQPEFEIQDGQFDDAEEDKGQFDDAAEEKE